MVGVLALSAVEGGFKPWLCKTNDYKIGISYFSTKHTTLMS